MPVGVGVVVGIASDIKLADEGNGRRVGVDTIGRVLFEVCEAAGRHLWKFGFPVGGTDVSHRSRPIRLQGVSERD